MAGDRKVLQADEALADIHTSPPILRCTSDAVDNFPAVAPLHHTCCSAAADTALHPAVSSQGDQDSLVQQEFEVVVGVVLVAVVGGVVVAAEVVAVVAVDGLHHQTAWYAMPPPVGQYR